MVAGDLVNTASRIQSIAPPGTVFVGCDTPGHRADDRLPGRRPHELEGKDGLFPLWQALRVVSGARGSLKSQGLEAPFVGRDRELRLIKEVFHGCADEAHFHLVSITGIAGIGKEPASVGVLQVLRRPAAAAVRAGASPTGRGVTYWALADMVGMRCRIAEEEQGASALAKLQAVVAEHIVDDEERRFVEPRVAQLLGLEDGPGFERDDLFSAWRTFFERLAEVNPVVMVFEDVQWADDSLLDFVDYLLERSRGFPLFVCTLARPELHERRPAWNTGRRNFTSLYLEPLSATAMDQLLTGLVPGLPDELRGQIRAAPRGSRCTRSRPSGCCSTAARSSRTDPCTARQGRSRHWRCRRRCRR